MDFSPVAIGRGRQIAERHGVIVRWEVGDVLEYDPPPVDFAMILYLHLSPEQLAAVLNKAAAALTPGGTLLVLGWDRRNATEGGGGPQPPEMQYTVDELVNAAGGLQVIRAEQVRQAGHPTRSTPCW